jgi:hypothetical protein
MKLFFNRPCALVLSALLVPSTVQAVAAPAPAAPTFTSKSDGFAIWLPGKPQIANKAAATPTGGTNVKYYTVAAPPLAFIVIPMQLPGTITPAITKRYFDGVQSGFTMSSGAKLVSSKTISLKGAAGREIVVKSGTNLIQGHFYAIGKRSYQVMAVSPEKKTPAQNAQIAKVLGSFRILP